MKNESNRPYQLQIAGRCEQAIFRFKVPIDDLSGVEIFEAFEYAGDKESSRVIIKVAPVPERRPQFTAETRLHQHVDVFRISISSE